MFVLIVQQIIPSPMHSSWEPLLCRPPAIHSPGTLFSIIVCFWVCHYLHVCRMLVSTRMLWTPGGQRSGLLYLARCAMCITGKSCNDLMFVSEAPLLESILREWSQTSNGCTPCIEHLLYACEGRNSYSLKGSFLEALLSKMLRRPWEDTKG